MQVFSTAGNTVNTMDVTTVPVNITVPQGDQTIEGGSSGTTANLSIGSTVSISVTGGDNTLNFAPTQFGITFNPNLNQGQMQQLDSSGNHFVAITGTFQNIVGTGKNDTLYAPDPVIQGPVTLQSFEDSHTSLTENGGNNTLYAAPMSTITVSAGTSTLYAGLPSGVTGPDLSTLYGCHQYARGPRRRERRDAVRLSRDDVQSRHQRLDLVCGADFHDHFHERQQHALRRLTFGHRRTGPVLALCGDQHAGRHGRQSLDVVRGFGRQFHGGSGQNTLYAGQAATFTGGSGQNTLYAGLPAGVTGPDLSTLYAQLPTLIASGASPSTLFGAPRRQFHRRRKPEHALRRSADHLHGRQRRQHDVRRVCRQGSPDPICRPFTRRCRL